MAQKGQQCKAQTNSENNNWLRKVTSLKSDIYAEQTGTETCFMKI